MTGYINNQIQPYPQFAGGFPTPQTVMDPNAEPSLAESLFNPIGLAFLPLSLSDPNVKNHIKDFSKKYGVELKATRKIPLLQSPIWGKITTVNKELKGSMSSRFSEVGKNIKGIDYKGIGKEAVNSLYNKEAITKVKSAKGFLSKTGKALKGIRGGAIFFGLFEIPALLGASKYGAVETTKQVGRSALNIAGNVVAFSAGNSVGAGIGAAIGTAIFPGIGTVIGGALGGLAGGIIASHFTGKLTKGVGDAILGKSKTEQEAELAQQQQTQTVAQANPFNSYSNQTQTQTQTQMMPAYSGYNGISLGDENMLNNGLGAYRYYQGMVA